MAFQTIKKASAPEMVAEQILNRIDTKELPPGSCLPAQREMAQLLGVGRSSVREAVNALVVMGYLEVVQGRGTFIRKNLPTVDLTAEKLNAAFKAGSIFDLMEARALLEVRSAALAAQRAESHHLQKLQKALKGIRADEKDYTLFLKADMAFHRRVAEATGNVVICEMTKLILEKVVEHHSHLKTRQLSPRYREISIQTAAKVIEYIKKQDDERASLWMEKHLNAITEELKDIT